SERFHEVDSCQVEITVKRRKALARPWVRGHDHPLAETIPHRNQTLQEFLQTLRKIDILLPVSADQEVVIGHETQAIQNRRSLDLRTEVSQHLPHRRTSYHNSSGLETLGEQIPPRMLGVGEVEI